MQASSNVENLIKLLNQDGDDGDEN